MKPTHLFAAANGLVNSRTPFFVWGSPGIGKSDIMRQVAASRSTKAKPYELRDVRLGLLDPTDIKGFPSPDAKTNTMRWLPPDFLPTKGQGLLFLDEMNTAPPAVQASAYQLVLNRRVGNYVLPDGWDVAAAGNNDTDRAVTHRMSTALSNRLVHLQLEVDVNDWVNYAMSVGIHADRIAFIRFRSGLLHNFDPNTKTHAFPSPRSWFMLDKIAQTAGLPREVEYEVLKGTVGEAAATEYVAFVRAIKDLPTIDEIALAPDTTPVPNSPNTQYAVTTMLSMATTENGFPRLMQYVNRMPKEFQVVYIRDCLGRVNKIKFTKEYKEWGLANADVVL
jgi:MoxR-like ATPase